MKAKRNAERPALHAWSLVALLFCVLSNSVAAQSDQASATIRYVQNDRARVLAGPGDEFYPTATLARGQSVEVYQQTHDGWLAIRPPQGSFSWLPAAQALLLPGGKVIEVTDKSAVSWIGTNLGTAKQYRWQVRLQPGEQLAVLGEKNVQDSNSANNTLWYKIAPPSGEYRWIRAADTSDRLPTNNLTARSSEESLAIYEAVDNETSSNEPFNKSIMDPEVGTAARRSGDQDSQVVQASATQKNVTTTPSQRQRLPHAGHRHAADPWDGWHAMEFKNGSFNFPGLSRMWGGHPFSPTAGPRLSGNGHHRHTPLRPADTNHEGHDDQPRDALLELSGDVSGGRTTSVDDEAIEEQMASTGRVRGWRDPHQLRQQRIQANAADGDVIVADAGLAEPESVLGTGVVQAAGWSKNARSGSPSDSWYGVQQAPSGTDAHAADARLGSGTGDELSDLQFRLSQMVAGPEYTWDLAPLAQRTKILVEHGDSPIKRGEARLLLERIEGFSEVARSQSLLGMSAPPVSLPQASGASGIAPRWEQAGGQASRQQGVRGQLVNSPVASSAGSSTQFDATGWLVPIYTSGREMPTHALTNDAGKIIVYLSAAPGINLTRFEAQQVGVYGLRGYLPQLKANHIQVERTVRLR